MTLLLLTFSLLGGVAHAVPECPDFTGLYRCSSKEKEEESFVRATQDSRSLTFNTNGEKNVVPSTESEPMRAIW